MSCWTGRHACYNRIICILSYYFVDISLSSSKLKLIEASHDFILVYLQFLPLILNNKSTSSVFISLTWSFTIWIVGCFSLSLLCNLNRDSLRKYLTKIRMKGEGRLLYRRMIWSSLCFLSGRGRSDLSNSTSLAGTRIFLALAKYCCDHCGPLGATGRQSILPSSLHPRLGPLWTLAAQQTESCWLLELPRH